MPKTLTQLLDGSYAITLSTPFEDIGKTRPSIVMSELFNTTFLKMYLQQNAIRISIQNDTSAFVKVKGVAFRKYNKTVLIT